MARLSHDLMTEFPDMKGFSEGNLKDIRRWYHFYSRELSNLGTGCTRIESDGMPPANGDENGAQAVHLLTQIPWGGHNQVIISKCNTVDEALFDVRKTIEHNWSRNVLTHQVESHLYNREGKAIASFSLPCLLCNLFWYNSKSKI